MTGTIVVIAFLTLLLPLWVGLAYAISWGLLISWGVILAALIALWRRVHG